MNKKGEIQSILLIREKGETLVPLFEMRAGDLEGLWSQVDTVS